MIYSETLKLNSDWSLWGGMTRLSISVRGLRAKLCHLDLLQPSDRCRSDEGLSFNLGYINIYFYLGTLKLKYLFFERDFQGSIFKFFGCCLLRHAKLTFYFIFLFLVRVFSYLFLFVFFIFICFANYVFLYRNLHWVTQKLGILFIFTQSFNRFVLNLVTQHKMRRRAELSIQNTSTVLFYNSNKK